MEFRQLEVFAAIAETGSFSKAADYLYLTQSTISSHMKNLEKELQKDLIIRSTRNIRLTEEGETFLFYVKRILDMKDTALQAINSPYETILHIGASSIPSAYLLPEITSSFRKSHAHVTFDIRQSDSTSIINGVMDGSIELGLVGQKATSPKCASIPFCSDELVIATPNTPYFQKMQSRFCSIDELLKEPLILREQGSGTQKAAEDFLSSQGYKIQDLNIAARINDLEAIRQMVVSGMGISIFSNLAVKSLEKHGECLLLHFPNGSRRQFYLTYLNDRNHKPALKEFEKFVLDFYK